MLLKVKDLSFAVGDQANDLKIHIDSLQVERGEKVLLLGDSGSGKTTFLNLITGILQPDAGSICIDGKEITKLKGAAKDRMRGESCGIIFQTLNLMPFARVRENILAAVAFAGARRARVGVNEVADLLAKLGLPPEVERRKAGDLSIGQQQRVSIARALIGAPPLLIADEPTSALDKTNRDRFIELLMTGLDEQRQALLMVSHDLDLATHFDRVVKMEDLLA